MGPVYSPRPRNRGGSLESTLELSAELRAELYQMNALMTLKRISQPDLIGQQRTCQCEDQNAEPEPFGLGHENCAEGYGLSNGSRLSCGALKKDSFLNLRAPAASSAC